MTADLEFQATSDSDGSYVDGIETKIVGTFEPKYTWHVIALNGPNEGCDRGVVKQDSNGRLDLFPFEFPIRKGDRFVLRAPIRTVASLGRYGTSSVFCSLCGKETLGASPCSTCTKKTPAYLTKAQLADEFEKLAKAISSVSETNPRLLSHINVFSALQERATELRIEAKRESGE